MVSLTFQHVTSVLYQIHTLWPPSTATLSPHESPENEGYFINLLLKVAKSQFVLVDPIHRSEFWISLIWPSGCYFQHLFLL